MFEIKQFANDYLEKIKQLGNHLNISNQQNEVALLKRQLEEPTIWEDPDLASKVSKKLKNKETIIEHYLYLAEQTKYLNELIELNDESISKEINYLTEEIEKNYAEMELNILLNGAYDKNEVIMTINTGVGGTDAQDWSEMLLRLYTRWLDKKNFHYDIIEITPADEAGIKSATVIVKAFNAYGLLKSEHGIHRLVRLSPYNANNKRQTSFSSVDVIPILENSSDFQIDPTELKIDTYRASGAGGQHINKTDSAVRITHLPSGTVVQCQNSRSQNQNKETAMGVLISKLNILREKEEKEKLKDIAETNKEISWGNQIRSYVFHPYTLVKDHRTNYESSNLVSIMNGEIDCFINAYLHLIKEPVR